MGLFGGGDSKSKTKVSTTTTQVDRRAGASDSAQLATEGSSISNRSTVNRRTNIKVHSVDAAVVSAALAGSQAAITEALSFSSREQERGARTVEAALANSGGELGGLNTLVKGGTSVAIVGALALVVVLVGLRR